MSFLDRFQSKISTVTAHGHLRKADGSEEIRVGLPKRKPVVQSSGPGYGAAASESHHSQVPSQSQSHGQQQRSAKQQAPPAAGSPASHASPTNSPRNRKAPDNNYGHGHGHGHYSVPGSMMDEDDGPESNSYSKQFAQPQQSGRRGHHAAPVVKASSPVYERHQQPPEERQQQQQHRGFALAKETSPSKGGGDQEHMREHRSPREINEARVQSDQDQLAFSRKARPVQYEPYKLAQYKKEKPNGYYELGKLQPDLNAEDLVQKRANMERIKAFSKNLRVINKTTESTKKRTASNNDNNDNNNATAANNKAKSTREKAIEFAKHIPKPRAARATASDDTTAHMPPINAQARPINSIVDDDLEDDEVTSELQQLQLRHQASKAQVEALIKKG
ncbi:TPA: hypothetical protein N0F65_012839 [Lagenidium giganteum]|uniref:Uncharacterized protein n=1 Tax=Lagenidium giganteum TaxID=4803 RepID=A0AAV2YNF7_9STRA|nr:TPA: hypothetical protein N0F65_012839 [Lagenidium giganteum]